MSELNDLEYFQELSQQLSKAIAEVFEILQPVFDGIMKAASELYDAVYSEYVRRGAVYGETPEGFTRWLQDMSEISRLEMEIYQIKQRQELMADTIKFREKAK